MEALQQLAELIIDSSAGNAMAVAIDGIDGSGKSTLATMLVPLIAERGRTVVRSSIDGFHNPSEVRYRRGRISPEGYYYDSFDYDSLIGVLLKPFREGRQVRTRVFDYRVDSTVDEGDRTLPRDAILVFDGIFLMRPEINAFWDFRIFVDVPFEVTLERAVERDAQDQAEAKSVRERYLRRYYPGQQIYLSSVNPRELADVVVNNITAFEISR